MRRTLRSDPSWLPVQNQQKTGKIHKRAIELKKNLRRAIFTFTLLTLFTNILGGYMYNEITETFLTLFFLLFYFVDVRKSSKVLIVFMILLLIGKNVIQIVFDDVSTTLRIYQRSSFVLTILWNYIDFSSSLWW